MSPVPQLVLVLNRRSTLAVWVPFPEQGSTLHYADAGLWSPQWQGPQDGPQGAETPPPQQSSGMAPRNVHPCTLGTHTHTAAHTSQEAAHSLGGSRCLQIPEAQSAGVGTMASLAPYPHTAGRLWVSQCSSWPPPCPLLWEASCPCLGCWLQLTQEWGLGARNSVGKSSAGSGPVPQGATPRDTMGPGTREELPPPHTASVWSVFTTENPRAG